MRAVLRKPGNTEPLSFATEAGAALGVTCALPAQFVCLGSVGLEFHRDFSLVQLFLAASCWCSFGDLGAAS